MIESSKRLHYTDPPKKEGCFMRIGSHIPNNNYINIPSKAVQTTAKQSILQNSSIKQVSNLEEWNNSINQKLLQAHLNEANSGSSTENFKFQTYKLAQTVISIISNTPIYQEARNSLFATSVEYGSTVITNVEKHNGTWTGKVYAGGTEFTLKYSSNDLESSGTWSIVSTNGEPYWGEGYLTTQGTLEITNGTITNMSNPVYNGKYSIDLSTGVATVRLNIADEDVTVFYNPRNNQWTLANSIESLGAAKGTPVTLMNNSTMQLTVSKEYYDVTYTLSPEGSTANYRFKTDKLNTLFETLGSDISRLTDELGLTPEEASKILTKVYTYEGDKTGDWIKNIVKDVVGDKLTDEQMEKAAQSVYDFTTNASTLKDVYEIFKIAKNGEDFGQLASLGKYAKPLGIVGGVLGIFSGIESMSNEDTVGGLLNIGSGVLTIAAVGLTATGVGAPIAATLFMASTALDVASLAWEYKDEIKEAAENVGKSAEEFVNDLIENPVETLASLPREVTDKLNDFKNGLIELKSSIENAFNNASDFFKNVANTAIRKLDEYSDNPKAFVEDVVSTAVSTYETVQKLISGGVKAVEEAFEPKGGVGGEVGNPSIYVNVSILNTTENMEMTQGTNSVKENLRLVGKVKAINQKASYKVETTANQAVAFLQPITVRAIENAIIKIDKAQSTVNNVTEINVQNIKQNQTNMSNNIVFSIAPQESALKLFG